MIDRDSELQKAILISQTSGSEQSKIILMTIETDMPMKMAIHVGN